MFPGRDRSPAPAPGLVPNSADRISGFKSGARSGPLAPLCGAVLLLGALGFQGAAQAQDPSSETEPSEQTRSPVFGVVETYLDNGLKVLLKEDHSSPVVSVGLWLRVGSHDSGLGTSGISHFVEHLTLSSGKASSATDRPWIARHAAGLLQGYTFLDQTAYFASVVKSDLDHLLELVARPLRHERFESGRIELERGLVIAELLRREDDSRLALDWEVATTALKRHPYRWPAGGWVPDVEQIKGSRLWDHYRRYYTPANAILVLVGDIDADRAMRAVRRRFGVIPRGPAPPRAPLSEPEQRGERRLRLTGPGNVPYLQMAFRAPGIHQSDLYGLWVLDAILCRAKGRSVGLDPLQESAARTSRLYRALVDSEIATHVHSSLHATRHPYLYKLLVTLPDGSHFELAEEMLDHELERLRNGEISDGDLDRARRQIKTRFLLDRNSSGKLAHQLGNFESIASFQILQRMEEKIDGVSRADLQRVARPIFSKEARTVGWYIPRPETPVIGIEKLAAGATDPISGRQVAKRTAPSPPSVRPVLGPPGHGAMFPVAQVAGSLAVGAAVASRNALSAEPEPLLGSSRLQQPLPASWITRRQVLGNGMVVWVASQPVRESFSLRLTFRAGAVKDSDDRAGLAHLSGRLLPDGADEAPSPAESIESSGVSVGIETNYLATALHLQGRGEDLAGALASSSRMVRNPDFSETDFRREKGVLLNELRLESDSGAHTAEQAFRRRIHPYGHPFGRNLKGSPETVEVLQPSDVEGFRQRFYRPNRLILSVVSDRGVEEVLSAIEDHFGDWQASEAPESPPVEAVAPGLGTGRHLIRLRGSSYGTLVYGLPGLSRRHPDYFPMLVLSQILGQEARLGSATAGPEGPASYPFSAGGASLEGGVFMIRLGVKPGELESVVTYLREQMADLRDREVTLGEVAAAKNFLLNRMMVGLSSNSGLTAALTQAEWFAPGDDALRDWLDRVHGVTVDQVIDVSRTRLLLDRAATVIAGPEAVLR